MDRFRKTIEIPFETLNKMDSWEDFEAALLVLDRTLGSLKEEQGSTHVSRPLFRGHSNNLWPLESTLNRATGKSEMAIGDYFKIASEAAATVCGAFPTAPKFHEINHISDFDLVLTSENIRKYIPSLAYLRHHGFPSPLLDWSQSKDIAAYFAFRELPQNDFVSIYVLLEYLSGGKIVNASKPRVTSIGNTLDVHTRHKNQQSEYTVCLSRNGPVQYFTQHELVLTKNDRAQDVTLKFDIPSKERSKVMNYLINKGITDSFIMGPSEDSLMKSLTYKFFR